MVTGCLIVIITAMAAIGVVLRRAYRPAGIGFADFVFLSLAAGAALGAWAIGIVALIVAVAP